MELRYIATPGDRYVKENSVIVFDSNLGFTENGVTYLGYRACKQLLDSKPPYIPISYASGLMGLVQKKSNAQKPEPSKKGLSQCFNIISGLKRLIIKK